MNEETIALLDNAYEMHVHTAPSHLNRRLDDFELAAELDRYKMAGAVIKTHYGATTSRAILANKHAGCKAKLFGSVTLDWPSGGLNPYAVESNLLLGASIVWMPTFHAMNQIVTTGSFHLVKGPGIQVIDEYGKVKPEVIEIIDLVKQYNAVIGTGHISAQESLALCCAARDRGADIILTHPDSNNEHVPLEIQLEIAKRGAFIEKCWLNLYKNEDSAQSMAMKIKKLSPERCIMSTDLGNSCDDTSPVGLAKFIDAMMVNGIPASAVRTMIRTNPEFLLRVQ